MHTSKYLLPVPQVGSINFTAEEGKQYAKGDEMGYFAFGGSTTIALFQPDTMVYDEDLASNRCLGALSVRAVSMPVEPHACAISPRNPVPIDCA